MLKGKTHHIMIIFFNCIDQRRSSANWNILITFSEVTNIFSELGIGTIECSKYYCISIDESKHIVSVHFFEFEVTRS